jgi:polyisoprenyl-phosphate glycosyltransferase
MELAIVIPVYNEQENLAELHDRLLRVCSSIPGLDWQVIFVNDGSSDKTASLILERHQLDVRFTLVDLSRNFGHQAAISAGLAHADADATVVMDADLQDPPELIPQFLERWREGYEVDYAVRRRRKESMLKRAAYAGFYRLMRLIAKIDIPLDAGDFCLMDRRVVEVLVGLPECNRFIRGLRSWIGFRQAGVEYDRAERFAGTTKYSMRKLVRLALSGFIGFSSMPLRLAAWLGFAAASLGLVLGIWTVLVKLLKENVPIGWSSNTAIVLFLGGTQLLMLGIFGEYLGNVYDEVRNRPVFIVRRRVGVPDPEQRSGPGPAA